MKKLIIRLLFAISLCLGYHLCFWGWYIGEAINYRMYGILFTGIYLATIVYIILSIWLYIKRKPPYRSA